MMPAGMMTINQEFVIKVEEAFPDRDTNLLMVSLCPDERPTA